MSNMWLPVTGYPDYEIHSDGTVRRLTRFQNFPVGYILKPVLRCDGYTHYTLSRKGRVKLFVTHQLVASHFLGAKPSGKVVNHKDGIKTNNCAFNLEYVTPQENELHASRLGLKAIGSRNYHSKFSLSDIQKIRARYKKRQITLSHLASEYNVDAKSIHRIVRREIYRWVP